jgi:hypothetical protein
MFVCQQGVTTVLLIINSARSGYFIVHTHKR